MQTKKQAGFTLIELMIVVAIVGILAAVAIPAYQDYIKRSKISEAMATAGACKTSVAEYAAANNALPGSATSAGCSGGSQYVDSLTVAAGGVISVEINDAEVGDGSNGTIVLSPVDSSGAAASGADIFGWNCTNTLENSGLAPASCR
ncbi:pilin [Kangiella taiwanensis]|uniref:Pilin n=1 Tax=Kangiella taiwanensis TaxID=1079179 RepID=A0ABP8I3H1_9GAMM|nr:pilin [Kangiella taiwanensis]